MSNRLHAIPDGQTDRQTNGQTSSHGIVRAMHMRCMVKIVAILYFAKRLRLSTAVCTIFNFRVSCEKYLH